MMNKKSSKVSIVQNMNPEEGKGNTSSNAAHTEERKSTMEKVLEEDEDDSSTMTEDNG